MKSLTHFFLISSLVSLLVSCGTSDPAHEYRDLIERTNQIAPPEKNSNKQSYIDVANTFRIVK